MKAIEKVATLYERRSAGEDVAAAENAALVEYGKARGEAAEHIVGRENEAIGAILGVYPRINPGKAWKERISEGAADALIEIVCMKAKG
jgi:hypothetical protein